MKRRNRSSLHPGSSLCCMADPFMMSIECAMARYPMAEFTRHMIRAPRSRHPSMILPGRESVNRGGGVCLPRPENGGGELRFVRGVGEVLSLETKTIPMVIFLSPFAHDVAVKKVSAIKLKPGFRCQNFHNTARCLIIHSCGEREPISFLPENEVVVIPAAEMELFVILFDPRADRSRGSEIHR